MDQLCYTWTTAGMERAPGFQVRAASAGLRDLGSARYAGLRPYLTYELPLGAQLINPERAPICLTLVDAGQERVLLHKVHAGVDSHGRPGVFFIHALVGQRDVLTLPWSVQTWRAPFWKRAEADLAAGELGLPACACAALDLGAPALAEEADAQLGPSARRFIVAALLSTSSERRVYLAANPHQVIALLRAALRVLPRTVSQHITFSTYERDVFRCSTLVIGASWPAVRPGPSPSAAPDLPDACYRLGYAFNLATGRRSERPFAPGAWEYAQFAVDEGSGQATPEAAAFFELAEAACFADPERFLRAYRWYGATTSAEPVDVLDQPELLAFALPRPERRAQFLEAVLQRPDYWRGRLGPLLVRTRTAATPPVRAGLAALAEEASALARLHAEAGAVDVAALLHDELAGTAAPDSDRRRSAALLTDLAGAAAPDQVLPPLPAPMEHWLLQVAGRADPQPSVQRLGPWLRTSWSRLPELLAANLPAPWKVAAAQWLIHDAAEDRRLPLDAEQHLDPAVARLLREEEELFARALCDLVGRPKIPSRQEYAENLVHHFFVLLAEARYPRYPALLAALLTAELGASGPGFYQALLSCLRRELTGYESGKPEILLGFVEGRLPLLVARGAIAPGATSLVASYLRALTARRCKERPETWRTIRDLDDHHRGILPAELRRKVAAWRVVAGFLHLPSRESSALRNVLRAVGDLQPSSVRIEAEREAATQRLNVEILEAFAAALAQVPLRGSELEAALRLVHEQEGKIPGWRPCELLRQLVASPPWDDRRAWLEQQATYVAVGLTYSRPPCNMTETFQQAIRRHQAEGTFKALDALLADDRFPDRITSIASRKAWQRLVESTREPRTGLAGFWPGMKRK